MKKGDGGLWQNPGERLYWMQSEGAADLAKAEQRPRENLHP